MVLLRYTAISKISSASGAVALIAEAMFCPQQIPILINANLKCDVQLEEAEQNGANEDLCVISRRRRCDKCML